MFKKKEEEEEKNKNCGIWVRGCVRSKAYNKFTYSLALNPGLDADISVLTISMVSAPYYRVTGSQSNQTREAPSYFRML